MKAGQKNATSADRSVTTNFGTNRVMTIDANLAMKTGRSMAENSNGMNRYCCPANPFSEKYQPSRSAISSRLHADSCKDEDSAPRPKPSTEYSFDPSAFSAGSMVLPGESLAKYDNKHEKKAQPARHATETAAPEAAVPEKICLRNASVAETQQHGFLQDVQNPLEPVIPPHFEEEKD